MDLKMKTVKLISYIATLAIIVLASNSHASSYMNLGSGLVHDVETSTTHYCFQTGNLVTCQ